MGQNYGVLWHGQYSSSNDTNMGFLWVHGGWVRIYYSFGGARDVMFIVVGNGHGDTSSNPGRDWLHFT